MEVGLCSRPRRGSTAVPALCVPSPLIPNDYCGRAVAVPPSGSAARRSSATRAIRSLSRVDGSTTGSMTLTFVLGIERSLREQCQCSAADDRIAQPRRDALELAAECRKGAVVARQSPRVCALDSQSQPVVA